MRAQALGCVVIAFCLCASAPIRGADEPAELVVLNAKVLTVDSRFTTAQAVAIRDGLFVVVGSNADAQKLVGAHTRVIDARGKTVVPGLIESHIHATGAARGETQQPYIQLGSIAEIQEWVRNRVASTPDGEWVQIPRADLTRLKERRLPTRAELDAAAPDRPVVFNWQYAARQVQILNTAALKAAKITRDTPDPPGGKVVKDASGEPTGRLEDPHGLIAKHLTPKPVSDSQFLTFLERMLRSYNETGITSVGERNSNVEGYRAYETLKQQGRLTVRANVTIGVRSDGSVEGTEKFIKSLPFRFGDGDDWVRVGPLKMFVDGGVLYGTAHMRAPYGPQAALLYGFTDPDYHGAPSLTPEKILNIIRTGHRIGWQMCSHVTGDAGVDAVLDAVEAVNADRSIKDRRYTLIHAYFPNPEAIRRAVDLGVCVDTQPAWYYKDGDALANALGMERMEHFIGLNDWLRGGVKVAINSDHMQGVDPDKSLNPFNPFLTMYTAITRKTEAGTLIGPQQKVSRTQALRMMTIDAAYLSFDEAKKGSIEIGKLGDLAVLSDDLLTCDESRIKEIRPLITVVGGRVVFEAGSGAGSPSQGSAVLAPGAKPELLQEQGAGEGPAWHPELGLLTSGSGHIYRRSREGTVSVFRRDAGSNGLLFDREGRLLTCEPRNRRVTRLEADGRLTILADRFDGMRFNQPNDLALDSKNRIYFSDPCYGDRSHMELVDAEGRKVEGVYRIDADGTVTRIITHETERPNGLAISADDRFLYVADNNNDTIGGARKLWRFDLRPDGAIVPASRTLLHDWGKTRGPDGIKLDSDGRLFAAAGLNKPNAPYETQETPTAGVYVFSPDGRMLEQVPIPRDECTNCAFGGDDLKTLFVTAGGSLWSVRVQVAGRPVWPRLK
jgi:predicted amidohydrolase YtcJ/sugar lactone lactonase YvrE